MKKLTIICLFVFFSLSLTACSRNNWQDPSTPSIPAPDSSEVAPVPLVEPSQPEPTNEILPPVADAVLYRGVVESVETKDGVTIVKLAQAAGTDFGKPTLTVTLESVTRRGFVGAEPVVGDYLEVYYSATVGQPTTDTMAAIQVSLLPATDTCLYNGVVAEITAESDKEGYGDMMLTALTDSNEIVFHYTPETRFYLDFSALKAGDKVNIFFNGVTTRSIPPQATALEVCPYAE